MKTIMSARTLLAAGTMLTMSVCASAQKQAPPQGSAPKPFTVPAHETYLLPNGMKVTLVPYGNLPKVTVSAVVNAGNLNESATRRRCSSSTSMKASVQQSRCSSITLPRSGL